VVDYWKVRRELFGEDRAYLPLTLTGDGALSEEDMQVLRTGAFMILPKTVHGKPTLFHDRSRYEGAALAADGSLYAQLLSRSRTLDVLTYAVSTSL
jgi:hypothetical protein